MTEDSAARLPDAEMPVSGERAGRKANSDAGLNKSPGASLGDAQLLAPRGRGRPKIEDVAALASHIVLVARDTFYELGLGNTTMEIVAQRARVSKATLYARFSDKFALFEAVMEAVLDAWSQDLIQHEPAEFVTLDDVVWYYIKMQIKTMLSPEFSNMHRVIIGESKAFPELGQRFLKKVNPERITTISKKIEAFAKADGIPCKDPESAADVLRGMVSGCVTAVVVSRQSFGPREQSLLTNRLTEIFMASRSAW